MLMNINLCGEEISQLTLPTFDDTVWLEGLSGDINQLLPLISCRKLVIWDTDLSRNDTEALVKCLNTKVSHLVLSGATDVDISVLCQYNGTGKCQYVECWFDSYTRSSRDHTFTLFNFPITFASTNMIFQNNRDENYRGQVTQWAHNMRWKVEDRGGSITITRN